MNDKSPYLGIISAERRRGHAEVADRAARIAFGLHALGVKPGDSVCILISAKVLERRRNTALLDVEGGQIMSPDEASTRRAAA